MFATKISANLYRVSHCAFGKKTVYKVSAVDAFSAILKLLSFINAPHAVLVA